MPLDLEQGYDQAKSKIQANQSYANSKAKYDDVRKKAGDSFEKKKSEVTQQLNDAKKQVEGYKKQIKNQFEQLLDISKITGGKGGNTAQYLKKTFIKVLTKLKAEMDAIIIDEIANALGCDQQQTYTAGQSLWIKVKSIDLRDSLKIEPETTVGKIFYERNPIQIQSRPFSMNKELYERIQSGQPYSVDNGQLYRGASGQPLFDIQYFDVNQITGVPGGWFKITLQARANNLNKVIEFLKDYYRSIAIFDFVSIMAGIMDALAGVVSIQADFGIQQNTNTTTFSLYIQRILGLCFDNAREIDVTGASKLSELDDIDDSFFELSDIDLRKIEGKVSNIQNGVIEFEDCDNVKLPVNSAQVLEALNDMQFIESQIDLDAAADNLTNVLTSNPAWGGFEFNANIQASVNLDFIKLIVDGILRSILTPKVLLPLITMFKAITSSAADFIADTIETYKDFCKKFKKMIINIISKIGALFVKELFNIIKKDLFALLQSIVTDVAKEQGDKRIIMIAKLIQLLLVIIDFIKDWRRCKSVIDELLKLLTIATTGFGFQIPQPLLMMSDMLDGYSSTRAFIGAVEEMQKLGIPTGDMPDGSPNLDVLGKYGQMKAQGNEMAENMKLQATTKTGSAIWPTMTVLPIQVSGKPV